MSFGGLSSSGPLKKVTDLVFGKTPKVPVQKVATPIEKVLQSNIADETTRKQLAKMRKATLLTQQSQLGTPNLAIEKLGAGA
jgi:hypothetical protein